MQHKKFIAAAVIEKDGRVLIVQRAKKDSLYGKWEFPGGKVEKDETLEECLVRELREELDIEVEVGEYLCTSTFSFNNILFDMCVFKVVRFTDTLILREHSDLAWVLPKDLNRYDFPEPDLPVVKLLQEQSK